MISFSFLGTLSLQTRTRLQKFIKGALNCCKLPVIFKIQNKLVTNFRFEKTASSKYLRQVWFISFSVNYAMNRVTENVLDTLL